MTTCTIEGCDRPHFGRGWCQAHYMRWWSRGGDPSKRQQGGARRQDPLERLMRHVETSPDGCWLWNGTTDRGGYGKAWFDGRMVQAHRAMFQVVAGEIPVGLHLDHLCRVRRCVNPEHLEAVTVGENTRRSTAPGVAGQHNAVKTHCPAGHLYDEANTYMYRGKRNCRACANARRRKTA